jgi:uncharacterized protein
MMSYKYTKLSTLILFLFLALLTIGAVSAAEKSTAQSNNVIHPVNLSSTTNNPIIVSNDPGNRALNVAVDRSIKIKFNQPIKIGTGFIELSRNGMLTAFNRTINYNTLTITPTIPMKMGSGYSVILHTSSVTNLNGNGISYSSIKFFTALKIDVINRATGGDVTKNSALNRYIQKTVLANQIISKAKTGTPMVTFGDGKGPRILIVAGVHGNELPATAAAMKFINYLNGRHIKGTIYIVPFAIPYTTAHNTRYCHGQDPNRITNVAGSPTNIIMNLAKQLHVSALGDFHSSIPGGTPGIDSALCTKIPMLSSYKIANYIAKYSGSKLIADQIAGVAYPGALEDVTNLNGIPAVTCEVLAYHGTLNINTINKSFLQMMGLQKYFGLV